MGEYRRGNNSWALIVLCVSLILVPYGFSQIVIEGEGSIDEISISVDTASSQNVGKSLFKAIGFSLLVPGGGQWYLQEKNTAKAFFAADITFWSGLLFSLLAEKSYLQSARSLASRYGGIDGNGRSEQFLDAMSRYRSYLEVDHRGDSYEQTQILSGIRDGNYEIPNVARNHWDFGSPLVEENNRNWSRFKQSIQNYGYAKVSATWFIGGLILGRALSALYALHLYRTTSVGDVYVKNRLPNIQIMPWVGWQSSGLQLTIGI